MAIVGRHVLPMHAGMLYSLLVQGQASVRQIRYPLLESEEEMVSSYRCDMRSLSSSTRIALITFFCVLLSLSAALIVASIER